MTHPHIRFSRKAYRTKEQPISYLMAQALANKELISLAAGFVDFESLPTEAVARATADLMADAPRGKAALQYGTTIGMPSLRERCLARFEQQEGLSRADLKITADNVVVTTGSQQMLYMLAEVLIDEGDIVINSAPSYFVYSGLLDSFGADVRSVTDDDGGMPVDALAEMLEHLKESGELAKVKLIYTVSYFQNPTGISVASDRRRKIVELAERYSLHHRIVVLEDAAYRELRYDGPDLPSLKRYDADNSSVVYTTTFSKPFSPGMKTGWTILPAELVGPVLKVKGNQDFGSSNLNQALLDKVLADGSYDRQVERLKGVYRAKRDAMLSAVQEHFGRMPGARWTKPDGGLYVWLQLPEGIDTGQFGPLFPVVMRHGVLYVPGALSYTEQPGLTVPKNTMRLSFGVVGEKDIRKGIARLAAAVAEVAAESPGGRASAAAAR